MIVTEPARGVPEEDGASLPLESPTLRLMPPAEPKPDAPVDTEMAPVSPVLPFRRLVDLNQSQGGQNRREIQDVQVSNNELFETDPVETVIVPVEPPFEPADGVVKETAPLPPFEAPDDSTKAP